jgi:hypothetical protein
MNNLNLKLAIGIILVFGALLPGFALFPVLRVKWFEKGLYSNDAREFHDSISRLLTFGKRGEEAVHRYFEWNDTGWSRPSCGLVARIEPPTLMLCIVKEIGFSGMTPNVNPEKYILKEYIVEEYIIIEIMNITSREIEIDLSLPEATIEPVVLSPCSDDYDEVLS